MVQKKLKTQSSTPDFNIKQVWGKVLTRLREINEAALFVSCGEVSDVKFDDETLTVQTDKKYLFDLMETEQNILTLKRALRFLGYEFDVKIELVEGKNEKIEQDIEFLKKARKLFEIKLI